jgi:hypothetical protein
MWDEPFVYQGGDVQHVRITMSFLLVIQYVWHASDRVHAFTGTSHDIEHVRTFQTIHGLASTTRSLRLAINSTTPYTSFGRSRRCRCVSVDRKTFLCHKLPTTI